MGLLRSFAGSVQIEITSASPADMLTAVNANTITLMDVKFIDGLRVRGSINRNDLKSLQALLARRGESVKILRREGLFWALSGLTNRPVLILGMFFLIALSLYLPTRVLFVEVEGNVNIATALILDKAEQCGIGFGASRSEVRSERMKNNLLAALPQLQWAGVNTSGCVAVISVQERNIASQDSQTHGVSSIVAARDGIIQQITVRQGNALCKVGDAVKAGQTLVSGYTDCGITIKAAEAEAEVYAQTLREIAAVAPANAVVRGEQTHIKSYYSLRIGKKVIKLYKDSGISDSSCVKMYSEEYLKLPGGFQLPVAIMTEQRIFYDHDTGDVYGDDLQWMENYASTYLCGQMLAGKILHAETTTEKLEGFCILYGKYACLEMIGRVRSEEIIR